MAKLSSKSKKATEEKEEVVVSPEDSSVGVEVPEEEVITEEEVLEDELSDTEEEDEPSDAKVGVTVSVAPVDEANIPEEKNAKIRMKEDHKCWVGITSYDLKKGQTYTVPLSVKKRLNKAGVLMPL